MSMSMFPGMGGLWVVLGVVSTPPQQVCGVCVVDTLRGARPTEPN